MDPDPYLDFVAAVTATLNDQPDVAFDIIRSCDQPELALAFAAGFAASFVRHLSAHMGVTTDELWQGMSLMATELTA